MKNIKVIIGRTNKAQANQGYTYNEVGFIYNQSGVMYGGLYDNDIYPLISRSRDIKPMNMRSGDIGSSVVPPSANNGMLVGMLGMTYP